MRIEYMLGDTPRRMPGRVALDDGKRTLTYGELARAVTDEANFLRASGGLRFALLAENGCGWALSDLALHHLQRLIVPLPAYFTDAQQRHVIDDAAVDTLITDRPADVQDRWPQFQRAGVSPVSGLHILRRTLERDTLPAVPAGVTKITYTSGSTGEPKGVCLSTATLNCVSRSLVSATEPFAVRRHLCLMPLPTLLENLAGVHAVLRAGATCLLPPGEESGMTYGAFDPLKLLRTVLRTLPESLVLVPELLRALVRGSQAGHPLPRSLKFIAVGGAAVSDQLLDEAASLGLPVFQGYGLSECSSVVCLNTLRAARHGSVGRPLPHVRLRVAQSGEIRVRGAVMSGYLGEPPLAATGEIATGDLGEIDADGYLYIRGRLRNTFITSFGRNVSPEWVERELTHETPIRHALAYGEGQPVIVALVSPSQPGLEAPAIDQAVRRANSRLPDYAQVHRWARLPEVPTLANGLLTANGRLRRERVLERFGALLREAS